MALPTSVQIVPGHMVLSGNVHTNDTSDTFCIDHTNGIVGIGQSLTNLVNDSNVLQISGRVHATRYYGDGSQLTGLTDSKWLEDENDINDIYYSAGNVGIGGAAGTEKLTVHGHSHMISPLGNGNVGMIAGNSDRQWRVGIRGDTNDDFAIQDDTAGQMRLRIDSSGNMGIGGAASSTNILKVHGTVEATSFSGIQASDVPNLNADKITTGTLGTDRIPTIGTDKISGLGFLATVGSYPRATHEFTWQLGNTGNVSHAGYSTNGDWYIRSNNNAGKVIIQDTGGNMGVGTSSPMTRLHVEGSTTLQNSAAFSYFNHGDTSLDHGSYGGSLGASIYASSGIVTAANIISMGGSVSASDSRIKKEIVDVEDGTALETLRLLKPKQYKYVDELRRGAEPVWGFIAQEVRDTLPYATRLLTECIPSIYELVDVSVPNTITFSNFDTSGLDSNVVLKVFDKDDIGHLVTITDIVDEHSIRVDKDLSEWIGSIDESGNVVAGNQLFVYGQQVDDFVFLNKDAIWTIAAAALQEVDHQLQAEKEKVKSLEERLAALEAIVLNQ